jgi:hypothetical protein
MPVGDVFRQLLAEATKVRLDSVLRTGLLADKGGSHADEHPVFLGHALRHVDSAEATAWGDLFHLTVEVPIFRSGKHYPPSEQS